MTHGRSRDALRIVDRVDGLHVYRVFTDHDLEYL